MSVPKELMSNISKDEMILYTSDNLINKRLRKIEKVFFVILSVAITAFFYSIVAKTLISDWLEENFGPLDILLFLLPLIGAVGFPFLFRSMINTHKKDEYLLVTNKKLYIYRYSYERKSQTMQVVDLNSIIGFTYKRGRFNEKGNFGTLEIIWSEFNERDINVFGKNDSHTPTYLLKNIPNFTQFQKLLESILYSFGGIQEKWEEVKNSLEWRIPMRFHISENKLKEINKRRKKLLYYIFLIPLICGMIFIALLSFTDISMMISSLTESPIVFVMYFIGLYFTPTFGAGIPLTMIYERKKIKKRSESIHSKLIIQNDKIIHENNNKKTIFSDKIPLGKSTFLSFCKIKKPFDKSIRWGENVDGIVIRPSFDSKNQIIFGPIDNFSKIYKAIFYYFLSWKMKNGLLYQREDLLKRRILANELTQITTKQKIYYTDIEPMQKNDFTFIPSDPSGPIYNKFINYLNPEEKILFTYRPSIKLYKNLILITVSTILLIGGFYLIIYYMSSNPFYIVFLILILVAPMVICITEIFVFPSKRLQRNSIFIFTTEKLIAQYGKHYLLTPYENIESVGKARSGAQKHTVIMNLKVPNESNPFLNNYTIFISKVPNEEPLLEKIRFLIDNISKLR